MPPFLFSVKTVAYIQTGGMQGIEFTAKRSDIILFSN